MKLYDERERHWRMFFKYNGGGLDNKKSILHAKRWDVPFFIIVNVTFLVFC